MPERHCSAACGTASLEVGSRHSTTHVVFVELVLAKPGEKLNESNRCHGSREEHASFHLRRLTPGDVY